jgi:hypothetical protein
MIVSLMQNGHADLHRVSSLVGYVYMLLNDINDYHQWPKPQGVRERSSSCTQGRRRVKTLATFYTVGAQLVRLRCQGCASSGQPGPLGVTLDAFSVSEVLVRCQPVPARFYELQTRVQEHASSTTKLQV